MRHGIVAPFLQVPFGFASWLAKRYHGKLTKLRAVAAKPSRHSLREHSLREVKGASPYAWNLRSATTWHV
jgi:hypothetical protein